MLGTTVLQKPGTVPQSYGKYGTKRVDLRWNVAWGKASCYICLSPTLSMPHFNIVLVAML